MKQNLILVVEDDDQMRGALHEAFAAKGYALTEAVDGVGGLTLALSKHPDCILLDIMLPKMDGISMMRELRKDEWGKHVPIIILTNLDATDKIVEEIMKDQPSYYLLKASTSLDEVIEKVKEVI